MHYLASKLHEILYLAIGGVVTSAAEYIFSYNLIDLIKDKVAGLFSKPAPSVKK